MIKRHTNPGARWVKAYWSEDDMWFYFETDEDGTVLRQVELTGPDRVPKTAAAWTEWPDRNGDGPDAIAAYGAKYGALADQPITRGDPDFPGVDIDRDEFERVWKQARMHLEARWRDSQ